MTINEGDRHERTGALFIDDGNDAEAAKQYPAAASARRRRKELGGISSRRAA